MSRKFESRSMVFKVMTLVLACILVIGASVFGTLAWLTAQTDKVTNTFTSAELFAEPSNNFTLWEHTVTDEDKDGEYELSNETTKTGNTYDILPGVDIPKDPTVDVKYFEEHAYLYIKVTGTLPDGLTGTIDTDNWKALGDAYPGVYVFIGEYEEGKSVVNDIIPATDDAKVSFTASILSGNQIIVDEEYKGTADDITLEFEAYMVQATGNGDSAAAAWANTYGRTASTTP